MASPFLFVSKKDADALQPCQDYQYLNEGMVILIFSENLPEHQERTQKVLQCLQEHDLYLKAEKCKFDVQEVKFLGLIIRPNQLSMDLTKLAGISDWPAPTNIKGVQSFS
jgi:hypothetical protein